MMSTHILETYNKLFSSNTNGILEIDSGKKGKVFTIVACTHGNEPVGLHVIDYLIHTFNIKNKIHSGKIQCIIANIKALQQDTRFIDVDMNRVFDFQEKNKNSYEYKRAKELIPYLKKSDYIFDIHSASTPNEPFLIPGNSMDKNFINTLNIPYSLNNLLYIIHGTPLIKYVEKNNVLSECCMLEAGSHYEKPTIDNAISVIVTALKYYNIITAENKTKNINTKNIKNIYVKKSIVSQTMNSHILYSQNPSSFDTIKKGEKILFDGKNDYCAEENGYIILPTPHISYIGEEICYLGK